MLRGAELLEGELARVEWGNAAASPRTAPPLWGGGEGGEGEEGRGEEGRREQRAGRAGGGPALECGVAETIPPAYGSLAQ